MVLPHQRQPLAKFIQFQNLSQDEVARECFSGDVVRLRNLLNGHIYPSPDEIAALGRKFKLPIEVMLEPALLIYRNGPWPPLRGKVAMRHEFELRYGGVKVDPDPDFYESQLSGWKFVGIEGGGSDD